MAQLVGLLVSLRANANSHGCRPWGAWTTNLHHQCKLAFHWVLYQAGGIKGNGSKTAHSGIKGNG
eukprot:1151459-Pelagomonas_calceolata.AAC.5